MRFHEGQAPWNGSYRSWKVVVAVVAVASGVAALSASPALARHVERLRYEKWHKEETTLVRDLRGLGPAKVRLCEYGGLLGTSAKATGFFRAEKIDGRWWLVDPHGHLFISVGLCSVNDSGVDKGKLREKFGDETGWATATGAMLKSYSFNTLGCWSNWPPFRPTEQRMVYTERYNFMSTYKNRRPKKNGEGGFPRSTMPLFDPEWEDFCDRHAESHVTQFKDDPWFLGHFSDNELPFRPDSLSNYLGLPKTDPGYKEARRWWDARLRAEGKRDRKITQADQDGFLEHTANRYYTTVNAAIKRYDPNHLFIGSRIHGRTIRQATFRGSKAVDVVTVNYYHRWSAEQKRVKWWLASSGRPFIVSEWYAQSIERADTDTGGAGFRVKTDADRGYFYQNLTIGLLKSGGCVGWHWFKYGGDGEGYHKGLVSRELEPHTGALEVMGELNAQVYPLAARADLLLHLKLDHSIADDGADDVAFDSSIYGSDGTVKGGAAWTRQGRLGGALGFDGDDDRVELFNTDDLSSPSTFAFWMRPSGTGPGSVLSGYNEDEGDRWDVVLYHDNRKIGWAEHEDDRYTYSRTTVAPGRWYHVAVVHDLPGGTVKIYVNGREDAAGEVTRGLRSDCTLALGGGHYGAFAGSIDEVRIYNRALAAGEVRSLASARR